MGLFILVDSANNLPNHKEVDCVHRSPKENPPSLKLWRAEVDLTSKMSNQKDLDCVHRSPNENPPSLKLWRAEVENTGVEPVTSCMPCKRSSQLS